MSTLHSTHLPAPAPAGSPQTAPFISLHALVVAVSIGVGMIPVIAPKYLQWMPHSIHILIESGIVLASISAVVLNLVFNGSKGDTEAVIRAAKQAEAH